MDAEIEIYSSMDFRKQDVDFLNAVEHGHVEEVKILLKMELDFDWLNVLHDAQNASVMKILLESGKFNVNALIGNSETALHRTKDNDCLILLLNHGANINAKNSQGETCLMIHINVLQINKDFQHDWRVKKLKSLLKWANENKVHVDLNARDIYGETALIKAAQWRNYEAMKLLLKYGALDIFHDNQGFTALHSTIAGTITRSNYDDDIVDELFRQIGMDNNSTKKYNRREDDIIRMLLTKGRSDVNALDYRGNTVLDLAVQPRFLISQKVIDALKKSGAKHSPSYSKQNNTANNGCSENKRIDQEICKGFQVDNLGRNQLHRVTASLGVLYRSVKDIKNEVLKLKLFRAMSNCKDFRGRTPQHYVAMQAPRYHELSSVLNDILELEGSVNEKDNYGRTPMHYFTSDSVEMLHKLKSKLEGERKILKQFNQNSNDEDLRDINRMTPQKLWDFRRNEERFSNKVFKFDEALYPQSPFGTQLFHTEIDPWDIWKNFNYAFQNPITDPLRSKMTDFMGKLAVEIKHRDPRFECRPTLIGSLEEGTKIGLPDEFDFNFVLIKFGELCEVIPAPEAPNGYIHLKRKSIEQENHLLVRSSLITEEFNGFFNDNGILKTSEVASRFRFIYEEIMKDKKFWDCETYFEWPLASEIGFSYDKKKRRYCREGDIKHELIRPCHSIVLNLVRSVEGMFMTSPISVDISPCICIEGWWPDAARSDMDSRITGAGCYFVFDQPQRKYPWVPVSDPFARISFAPAESRMVKECSALGKAAYMVGKQLLSSRHESCNHTYMLKNCLFYCLEALSHSTRKVMTYEDITPDQLRFFVKKLMSCYLEFCLQDFVPCYLMPTFRLPVGEHLKSNHFNYSVFACSVYSSVCRNGYKVDISFPDPEPLFEKFNKEILMKKLSTEIPLNQRPIQELFDGVNPPRASEPVINRKQSAKCPTEEIGAPSVSTVKPIILPFTGKRKNDIDLEGAVFVPKENEP